MARCGADARQEDRRMRTPRALGMAVAIAASALLMVTMFGGVVEAAPRQTHIRGTQPGGARPGNLVRHATPNGQGGVRLYLGWRTQPAATALARAVSSPKSSSYGRYLTPAAFRSRFAPKASDAAAVQKFLRANGFHVGYTPKNRHYVSASGSVA